MEKNDWKFLVVVILLLLAIYVILPTTGGGYSYVCYDSQNHSASGSFVSLRQLPLIWARGNYVSCHIERVKGGKS